MNNWMENLQSAIAYIEENLTEAIKVRDVDGVASKL